MSKAGGFGMSGSRSRAATAWLAVVEWVPVLSHVPKKGAPAKLYRNTKRRHVL